MAASHRAGAASLAGHVAGLSCESLTIYVLGTAEGVPRGRPMVTHNGRACSGSTESWNSHRRSCDGQRDLLTRIRERTADDPLKVVRIASKERIHSMADRGSLGGCFIKLGDARQQLGIHRIAVDQEVLEHQHVELRLQKAQDGIQR